MRRKKRAADKLARTIDRIVHPEVIEASVVDIQSRRA